MKFSTGLLLATASVATAQVSYNASTDTWHCPVANGSYCAGDSLSSSIIILCTNGVGVPGNCDGHIQDRPPIDVYTAPCWQQSPTFGNATCSKNCTVWPEMGNPYPVPGSCSHVGPSSGSDVAGYQFNTTTGSNSTAPYGNSTSNATATSTHSGSKPTGPSSTTSSGASSATKNAAAAIPLDAATSVFGAALFAVAALAL